MAFVSKTAALASGYQSWSGITGSLLVLPATAQLAAGGAAPTITEVAAGTGVERTISPATKSIGYTGLNVAVTLGDALIIQAPTAEIPIGGDAPELRVDAIVAPKTRAEAIGGTGPTIATAINHKITLQPQRAALIAITGYAPTVDRDDLVLRPATAQIGIIGYAPDVSLETGYVIAPKQIIIPVTAYTLMVRRDKILLQPQTAEFSIGGSPPDILYVAPWTLVDLGSGDGWTDIDLT